MKVLITGGTGDVGKAVVDRLADRGDTVTVIGRSDNVEVPKATYRQCDVLDYEKLRPIVAEHDTVVHLAAIRSPFGMPGRTVFGVNTQGFFNVFEAAAEAGISRVVAASSINALGFYFGDRSFPLPYLPVDENIPGLATDAYSFSKQVSEQIGEYFWQRDGITSVSLRLPAVYSHEHVLKLLERERENEFPLIGELLSMPDDARTERLRRMHEGLDCVRRNNRADTLSSMQELLTGVDPSPCGLTREEFECMHRKADLFCYVDELDSAQSVEKALTAEYSGSRPMYINASTNPTGYSVRDLAKLFLPPIEQCTPSRPDDTALISIDRARELIGFEPEWNV
ncbi:MAG: NAD-dependent epimerase/dehydratase family protein [Spirochaetota bacterium]